MPRDALPPLGEGEYYHADLIGLPCVDAEGAPLGTVVAVENFGAGDLLEIERPDGKRALVALRAGIADLEDRPDRDRPAVPRLIAERGWIRMRPRSIILFERLLIVALALDLLVNLASWSAFPAQLAAKGLPPSPALILLLCLLSPSWGRFSSISSPAGAATSPAGS